LQLPFMFNLISLQKQTSNGPLLTSSGIEEDAPVWNERPPAITGLSAKECVL
jgi:hypothetical protein